MRTVTKDRLETRIYPNRTLMGAAAAEDIAACILSLLAEKDTINMIFAAAPSQNDVLASLVADRRIPWQRINAYHMDEYVGLSPDAPQRFANFLKNAIFDKVPFRSVNLLDGNIAPEVECARYAALLRENPVDIVCMGIGENGHIAFNDPHVADFNDPALVKVVDLDTTCRTQQVHDGCFEKLDDVPTRALTITIPGLCRAKYMYCSVPAATKAEAIGNMLNGKVTVDCPASILTLHEDAYLYTDRDSAARIL